MSLEDVFPSPALSDTEVTLLAEAFSSPVVVKYLKLLAANDAKELLALSALSSSDASLAKAHATVQGKLQVIATLLSIEAPSKPLTIKE